MSQPVVDSHRNSLEDRDPLVPSDHSDFRNDSSVGFHSNGIPALRRTRESFNEPQEWLTAAEAAQYLKVQKRTLLFWVRLGKVKAYSLSGTQRRIWRFLRSDLDDTIVRHSQRAAKERSNAA
jgi:excisionase family DNA binding protein